jgi:hypothetical protein
MVSFTQVGSNGYPHQSISVWGATSAGLGYTCLGKGKYHGLSEVSLESLLH